MDNTDLQKKYEMHINGHTGEIMGDYVSYQISASEALRAGGDATLEKQERIDKFKEAAFWSAKAFLAAKDNVYFRYLAISQHTCASGLLLLVQNDYNSVVLSSKAPEELVLPNLDDVDFNVDGQL